MRKESIKTRALAGAADKAEFSRKAAVKNK
jgi:hypothetical protein